MNNSLQKQIIKLIESNIGDSNIPLNLFDNRSIFQEELMAITELFLKDEIIPMEKVYWEQFF